MKLRQVENEDQSVKREDLEPGDKVEWGGTGCIYVVTDENVKAFACNLANGDTNEFCGDFPIHRIRITGTDDDGRLTWERIANEPKAVEWGELKGGDWFTPCPNDTAAKYPYIRSWKNAAISVTNGVICEECEFHHCTLYRAEPCGFDDETGETLWRRK